MTAVGEFVERAESRLEMRAKGGRRFSAGDRVQLEALKGRLADVLREPAGAVDLQQLYLRHLELSSRLRATA